MLEEYRKLLRGVWDPVKGAKGGIKSREEKRGG